MRMRTVIAISAALAAGLAAGESARGQNALGSGNALDANPQVGARGVNTIGDRFIDTRVRNLMVTGNVPTPEDRVEASRTAWQIEGVREVYNEIEVRDRGGITGYFQDVRISTELRIKILSDGEVSALNYSIETVNGSEGLIKHLSCRHGFH